MNIDLKKLAEANNPPLTEKIDVLCCPYCRCIHALRNYGAIHPGDGGSIARWGCGECGNYWKWPVRDGSLRRVHVPD